MSRHLRLAMVPAKASSASSPCSAARRAPSTLLLSDTHATPNGCRSSVRATPATCSRSRARTRHAGPTSPDMRSHRAARTQMTSHQSLWTTMHARGIRGSAAGRPGARDAIARAVSSRHTSRSRTRHALRSGRTMSQRHADARLTTPASQASTHRDPKATQPRSAAVGAPSLTRTRRSSPSSTSAEHRR